MHPRPTPALTHYHTESNLKKSLLLFAALSGALAPWAKLFAQTATNAAAGDEIVTLSKFEVQATRPNPLFNSSASSATKTQTPLIDVPQTVNVVSRDLFALQGARSIEDALLNVAGVSPSVGDGQRDQVYIRGFSAQYDQYLDGVRDEAMYFRDLANIDRIEVVEGPSAVLYGHGSAGGLVNRISRQPTTEATGDISATYGSWNQRRVELDAGGPVGPEGLTYRFDTAG
jgi:catecholate siderophore receptor